MNHYPTDPLSDPNILPRTVKHTYYALDDSIA